MVSADFQLFEPQLRSIAEDLDQAESDIGLLGEFSGTRDEHLRLAESIREQHRAAERLLERVEMELEIDSPEEDSGTQGGFSNRVAELRTRLDSIQRTFRRALLRYRGNAERVAREERALLLSGATTAAELRKRKARAGGGASTLNAAADVTTALQETVAMMNDEIDKSVGNTLALRDSTAAVQRTNDRYLTMHDVLRTSANLIRALERADVVDRWLMLAGLLLFAFVSFNILRKRIWIPGLHSLFSAIRYVVVLAFGSSSGPPSSSSSSFPVPEGPILLSAHSQKMGSADLGYTALVNTLAGMASVSSLSIARTTASLSTSLPPPPPVASDDSDDDASLTPIIPMEPSVSGDAGFGFDSDTAVDPGNINEPLPDSAGTADTTDYSTTRLPTPSRQRHYKPPVEREPHLEL
ncbi:Protein transport protein sec20 [Coemansia sp. RSA 1200]|nr:Protein transport protein sec20 [Coemansia sp. RSA 1200]